ncbi:TlpA disulfide reductase family protein [Runella limosa]|uniref:TlpA disulfide reductase family protein n=1 Tax=Runella limosa TaxID=370978 RepID=UPI0003F9CB72|nr:TlpA disulfide reductase family protein [Runella limosa]
MKKIFFYSLLLLLIIGCSEPKSSKIVRIAGNLKNLPDGTINVITDVTKIIDSTKTKNGKFEFSLPVAENNMPLLVEFQHIDSVGNKRFFIYDSKQKYRNGKVSLSYFYLEEGVGLNGEIEEIKTTSIKLPNKVKFVTAPIKFGKQTKVMFEDSLGFSSITKIDDLKRLIKLHPYSYYYLDGLRKQVSRFSNSQMITLLNQFDGDVKKSSTWLTLSEYVENRNTKKLDFNTVMETRNGSEANVLTENASLNMVILWASWCAPCRKEIPQLKKISSQFSNNPRFSMVSISLDENKQHWLKALDKEQMPWKQLLITKETRIYAKELFEFDGSIPTTLFVDKEGKIVKKFVGYDESSLREFEKLINNHFKTQKNDL